MDNINSSPPTQNREDTIHQIKRDIFQTAYKANPNPEEKEINNKIEKLLEGNVNSGRFVPGNLILGQPGGGNIQLLKEASQLAAKSLGLNFVENPNSNYKATKKDFIFVTIEPQLDNTPISDFPSKISDFTQLKAAGARALLIDSLPKNSPPTQNKIVSLLVDNKENKDFYIGATGNVGDKIEPTFHKFFHVVSVEPPTVSKDSALSQIEQLRSQGNKPSTGLKNK